MEKFNIKRVYLIIKKDIVEHGKQFMAGLSVIFGVYTIILISSAMQSGASWTGVEIYFFLGLFGMAIFTAGKAFPDFRSKNKTIHYLTLPANISEKFAATLIEVSLLSILVYTLVFYVYLLIMNLFGSIIDLSLGHFNLFTSDNLSEVWKMIVVQSVFLTGAAHFRRNPLFFTSLYTFAGLMILFFIFVILMTTLKNQAEELKQILDATTAHHFNFNVTNSKWLIFDVAKYALKYLLAPVLWYVTYLKIKEKEV